MRGKISDIARMLVEAEVITQQQLDECLAAFREKRKQGGKPRLFELLVRRGYATRDQLKSAINRYDRKQTVKRLGIDYKPQLLACPRCKTSLSVRNPEPGGHLLCTQCGQQLALAQEGEALLLSESELSETPATQPQQTIGDYRVLEQLDSDGTGSRYRAGHTESGELALIKLFDDTQASPEYTEKIQQRYRDSSAIQHHGLQRPLKLGEQGGCLYVVAEWPEGQTLAQRLETTPCLPVEQVLVIAISLCEALDELHRQGVIHRDIRPTRIWVTEQRIVLGDMTTTPQVMDHIMTVAASTQTEPFYLAPEQVATGGQVDQRADVYGLGATLYHLLCGTPPVEGLSPFEVLMRLAGGALPLASEVNPEVPPQLARIVDRMLASDPEERYPSVAAVREVLINPNRSGDPAATSANASAIGGCGSTDHLQDLAGDGQAAAILLAKPPRWLRASIYLFSALFATAIAWAYLSRVDSYIIAPGVVRPEGDVLKVQSAVAGPLRHINIKTGDRVDEGELLFVIGAKQMEARLEKAKRQLVQAHTEITELRKQLATVQRTQDAERGQQKQQLKQKQRYLERVLLDHQRELSGLEKTIAFEKGKLIGAKNTLQGAQLELKSAQRDLRNANEEYQRLKKQADQGILEKTKVREQQRVVERADDQVKKARISVSTRTTEVRQAELSVQQQEGGKTTLQSKHKTTRLQLKQEIANLESAIRVTDTKHQEKRQSYESQLKTAQGNQDKAALEVRDLQQQLAKYQIHAPRAGTITSIPKTSESEVVGPGDVLATIAPTSVVLVVEALVHNRDAGALRSKIGGPVKLKIEPFPFRDFGTAKGKLLWISPDAIADEKLGSVYRVTIGIETLTLERGRRKGLVGLGMNVTAEIVKERERVLAILFREIRDRVAWD